MGGFVRIRKTLTRLTPAVIAGAIALALAAPISAGGEARKPPSELWKEFPLGKSASQPARTKPATPKQPVTAPTRPGPVEQTMSSRALVKRAPASSPIPAETPKVRGSNFRDIALLLGYASIAVLLVLGGVRVHAHMLRMRRRPAENVSNPQPIPSERGTGVGSNPWFSPSADSLTEGEVAEPAENSPPESAVDPGVADEGSGDVAHEVATILGAAEEEAERIRREAHEEAMTIRRRAHDAQAPGADRLTEELERFLAESRTSAQSLRDEADGYAVRRMREAKEEAERLIAEASAQARARRSSAEETGRILDESHRRQEAWTESVDALEERLRGALRGFQRMSAELEELLREVRAGREATDKVETLVEAFSPPAQRW
jgi:hypothetical protein